jgi:hypothetical protein
MAAVHWALIAAVHAPFMEAAVAEVPAALHWAEPAGQAELAGQAPETAAAAAVVRCPPQVPLALAALAPFVASHAKAATAVQAVAARTNATSRRCFMTDLPEGASAVPGRAPPVHDEASANAGESVSSPVVAGVSEVQNVPAAALAVRRGAGRHDER